MADDYSRIAEWERRTGAVAATIRRDIGNWDNVPDFGDVPF